MKFLSSLLTFCTTSFLFANAVNGIVVGSPTLGGSTVYQHLVIAGVPLPSNVTAQDVFNGTLRSLILNTTSYTNWTSATGNTTGTNVLASLNAANISYTIYADNTNDTQSLFLTQLPRIAGGFNSSNLAPLTQFQSDAQSGALGTVSFYNTSSLTVDQLGTFWQQAQPLVQAANLTILVAFIPVTPPSTPVQLPNFIAGNGITPSYDTISHTQVDIAAAISAIYLKNFPQLQSHAQLQKLFSRNYKQHF